MRWTPTLMHTECQNCAYRGVEVSRQVGRKLLFIKALIDEVVSFTEGSSYPHVVCANFCILAENR
jgi:hypothetical protein